MTHSFYNEDIKNFEVGSKVQFIQDDGLPRDGEVLEVFPPVKKKVEDYDKWYKLSTEEQDEMISHSKIRWSSGVEEVLATDSLSNRDNEMERQFRLLCYGQENILKRISEKVQAAAQELVAAESLSERYGIPFSSNVSPIRQSYKPITFTKKFTQLDFEFVNEVTGSYMPRGPSYEGWEHSAVC